MAENLTATFSLVDQISSRLDAIATAGLNMIDRLERAAEVADSLFDALDSGGVTAARSVDGVATSCQSMGDSLEAVADLTDTAEQAMSEYEQALAAGSGSLDEWERAARSAADATAELETASSSATDAADELSDATADAAGEAENSSQKGVAAVQLLSNTLTAAGISKAVLEIAGALMEASEAAAEFETATMKISTIADTSAVSMAHISSEITALSTETGQSVNELSEAAYSALSASVETASAVEFTATATKLAAGGFTSSATAVDVLTTALNAYGLEASNAESISDMLITTQNLGKTTVDELAASVGKVIPLASAYGVEMDNLSAAYAELTKGGIATAEAGTYLKSMLNELGDSGSAVSAVLREQAGASFSQLMEQGYSLGDVMDILGESVNGNAGAFNELWSSSEAGIGALSLYNAGAEQFNTTLDAMQNSIGATETAYSTMTNTTAHAQEELSNAAANLQISIGQSINPLVESLYDMGAGILNAVTEFTSAHPVIVKVGVAAGVAVVAFGAAAVAVHGVTLATTVAIPALTAFGAAVYAALGPVGLAIAGVAAVAAGVAALVSMLDSAEDETEGMTAVTRAQYYELQSLNEEYERACEQYGETSDEALRLQYQVDDLSAAFEANRQTVEEFTAEVDALCESVHSVTDDFNSALTEINAQETGTLALIQKYEDLATQIDRTDAEQAALEAVTKKLTASYPELAEQLENASMSTDDFVEAMKRACEQQAEQQRQQEAQETYIAALEKQAQLEEEIAKATANVTAEQERMNNMSGWDRFWASEDDLKAYEAALDELTAAQAENKATIARIEQEWADAAAAAQEATDSTLTYEQAVSTAYESVRAEVEELCAAYDEAYQSALESFEGQFGLFDEAAANMDSTVANAQATLDSQLAYWESYNANLETLTAYGETLTGDARANYDALLAYVQDGSEEAAGLADSIADAIASGDEQAIADLSQTISDVSAAQQAAAATTAEWQTDFTEKMQGFEEEMRGVIQDLDMGDEAKANAEKTISDYAAGILAGKADAVAAAQDVARSVAAALSSASANTSTTTAVSVEANASGTTNAGDIFIAGEDGPELIVGKAGSTVFPADETERIISAVSENDNRVNGYDFTGAGGNVATAITPYRNGSAAFPTDETERIISAMPLDSDNLTASYALAAPEDRAGNESGGEQTKRITLEIAGGSPIEVNGSGGASKEDIVEILVANLRPALLNLVSEEIFEEGDGSYEY